MFGIGSIRRWKEWKATCAPAGSVWACAVDLGQCVGRLTIYGTPSKPKARNIRIGCGE